MKRYKLIKEYPGSPFINTEVLLEENLYVDRKKLYYILKDHVEKNIEYWQEIIEKDYEILSFKQKQPNGTFTFANRVSPGSNLFSGGNIHKCSEAWLVEGAKELELEIYSVKRLSDGEIFTIGDNIEVSTYTGIITKMYVERDCLVIDFGIANSISNQPHIGLFKEIKKSKQKLFTTEDGVDIFDKDGYYELGYTSGASYLDIIHGLYQAIEDGDEDYDSDTKRFSTKEKAQEYIDLNKPQYSLNDMLLWAEGAYPHSIIARSRLRKSLKIYFKNLTK